MFGSCRYIVEDYLPRFGVASTLVDGADLGQWRAAVRPNTKAFFLESPTNPTLEVIDIAAVANIAHDAGARLTVDNVFATPLWQSPLALGAGLRRLFGDQAHRRPGPLSRRRRSRHGEIHSRQYSDSIPPDRVGAVAVQCLGAAQRIGDLGGARREADGDGREGDGGPRRSCQGHAADLSRPRRPPQAEVIKRQMRAGSTLIAFEVGGGKAAAFRFLNALKLVRISNNLGDAKSLIVHPATTTHQRLTQPQRDELGISDGLLRFSAGLEHADDLIEDVLQALEKV